LFCIFSLILVKQVNSQILIGLLFGEALNKGPIEFGLDIIANSSKTTIDNGSDNRNRLGFGLYLDYKIADKLILSGSFFFASPKGESNFNENDPLYDITDTLLTGSSTKRDLNYFDFPVTIEYRPFSSIGIGFGGYISYLMSANDYYKVTLEGNEGNVVHERSILSEMNRFDYGLIGNVHYHFKGDPGAQIMIKYMYGLADILKNGDNGNGSNETFQIGVMIPIKFGIVPSEPDDEEDGIK